MLQARPQHTATGRLETEPMAYGDRKLARLPRALEITGLKRSAFYDKVSVGIIPKPIKIDPNGRAVAWIEDELLAIQDRAIASREQAASAK
jgi:predicted DNA-binding transcriptional regulator AlpA